MSERSIFKRAFLILQPMLIGSISTMIAITISGKSFKDNPLFTKVEQASFVALPPQMFSIVWTTLYIAMGYAAYRIYSSKNSGSRETGLLFNQVQLLLNFSWSVLFFGLGLPILAFINILFLIFFVSKTAKLYYTIDKISSYLLLPYLLWILFAAYLNFLAF